MYKELNIRLAGALTRRGVDVVDVMAGINDEPIIRTDTVSAAGIMQMIMVDAVAKFVNDETKLFDVVFWGIAFFGAKIFDSEREKHHNNMFVLEQEGK